MPPTPNELIPEEPMERDPRFPRRSFLRAAGLGAGALALGPLLAACGREPAGTSASPSGFDWSKQRKAGTVTFANWPLYIDKRKVDGKITHPSLDAFTQETGIRVEYLELIEDYASFFGKLQPLLDAGRPTGFDLIVMGYPKWLPLMISRGYLVPLDHSFLPNFEAHAAPKYKEAPYDPGNRWSIPYQSGITGIGYNIEKTGREITSIQELFNPEFRGSVGMFRDTEDTPNMALIALGVNPPESTEDDWKRAAELLTRQRDDGLVRQYFGQGYIGALQNGEVALTLAWSADVLQSINSGFDNLRFIVPEEGGLLWTDSMCIPIGAEHPLDAIMLMDHFFRPEIAAMLTSWIQNVSPVPEAQEILRSQGDPVAENPLVFPTQEMYARLRGYRVLDAEEQERWDDLFMPIYQA
jgi:spermidine/putrescine transport system substrate-binding protein